MGKRKGCFHCCKRRIICDMTEPQCQKCTKKGLSCSGIGIRYRFNSGIASRGKFRGRQKPCLDDDRSEDTLPESPRLEICGMASTKEQRIKDEDSQISNIHSLGTPSSWNTLDIELLLHQQMGYDFLYNLDSLDAETRYLFSHFSTQIAPFMVALDTKFNGYRTIILPLACHDPEVRKAVRIVAALHLGSKVPELRRQAQHDRISMILSLRRLVDGDDWGRILSPSHWVVILLFLVGEMITGGDDFSYLVRMLLSLVRVNSSPLQTSDVYSFLLRQSRMIELFGCPFLGEVEGIQTLSKGIDFYCDWISTILEHYSDSAHQMMISQILSAVNLAGEIYLNRAISSILSHSPSQNPPYESDIDRLKSIVQNVEADTPGSPAFVWVNFIGAAGSQTIEDRKFFRQKLEAMYAHIGFENITIGLRSLERLWQDQGPKRWTEVLPSVSTLVM